MSPLQHILNTCNLGHPGMTSDLEKNAPPHYTWKQSTYLATRRSQLESTLKNSEPFRPVSWTHGKSLHVLGSKVETPLAIFSLPNVGDVWASGDWALPWPRPQPVPKAENWLPGLPWRGRGGRETDCHPARGGVRQKRCWRGTYVGLGFLVREQSSYCGDSNS